MEPESEPFSIRELSLRSQRKIFGVGMATVAIAISYWAFFSDGFPILWGPTAKAAEVATGQELFEHTWTANDPLAHGDGLGPVFNAKSCAACHFQGGLGGGGGIEHNAVGFEVFPRPGDLTFRTGSIHNFSIDPKERESENVVHKKYPIIRGRTVQSQSVDGMAGCAGSITIPDFDPVRTQSVQATALFGAGWIDLISDRAILRNARNRGVNQAVRELGLKFDGIPVGRVRYVAGGIGKFGWKNQFATLEEFVAAACANEIGLGTPTVAQAQPILGSEHASAPDLDKKQFRALVSFVKTLPKPVEIVPEAAVEHDAAVRGKSLFSTVGCAVCHVPDLGGVKGVYSDFLLYTLDDPPPPGGGTGIGNYGQEPPPQLQLPPRPSEDPRPEEWKTPPLWGVADSAPYLHDGSAETLREAIQKHRGDAKSVLTSFEALPSADQAALLSFLGTLKAPTDAVPLRDTTVTRLTRR